MKLEGLIQKRLLGNRELTGLLTEYCGSPAIFFGDAPDNNQGNWRNGLTMPRISFNYDTLADKERKSAGSLYVSIYCENSKAGGFVSPENIAPIVTKLLKDVIFSPDDFGIFYCSWNRTDPYTVREKEGSGAAYTNNYVIGCDVTFDILEYPIQEGTDPDPVMALNRYIAETVPEAVVLYYHRIEDLVETSNERPVVYVRNEGYTLDRQTNTVCWMRGSLYIHVLCPDSSMRMKIITGLANKIALAGEVIMLDNSPMLVSTIEGNNSADYMTVGQVRLETTYGILRTGAVGTRMAGVNISGDWR